MSLDRSEPLPQLPDFLGYLLEPPRRDLVLARRFLGRLADERARTVDGLRQAHLAEHLERLVYRALRRLVLGGQLGQRRHLRADRPFAAFDPGAQVICYLPVLGRYPASLLRHRTSVGTSESIMKLRGDSDVDSFRES